MAASLLKSLLPLITIYVVLSIFWLWFAYAVAPNIITTAYNEQSLSILNWLFENHRSLPVEHFHQRWSVIAAALLIALFLHFLIVLFIVSIDRKYRLQLGDFPTSNRRNSILIAFSAAFLGLTAASWTRGDYSGYLYEWSVILDGRDPWYRTPYPGPPFNTYGPLFNAMAPLVWVNPLANKLLFAFSYVVYLIWLIKDFSQRQGFVAP